MRFGFEHSYAALPARLHTRVAPTSVAAPQLVVYNAPLAEDLGLRLAGAEAAAIFSGNTPPEDANLLAMAYAGHQFGVFVPSLGDGRAVLLGELRGRDGILRDVQLKGSGRTPFSRNGDGRAALGPMLREYLLSEAMHALGIPTTRSLAVVATGERVYREEPLPGAVLTRVAQSHIRVGTFQYFAARGDQEAVRALLDYVIARHYPDLREAAVPALALLSAVTQRQAALIAEWLRVGFIHGVMNTDNMSVAGETIDYGPCAFMDHYDPRTVFSSIDHGGRYAYANQAVIAQWNLARLAETLLPFIDADEARAVQQAREVLDPFVADVDGHFLTGMRRRLGFSTARPEDAALVRQLLDVLQRAQADWTLTLRALADVAASPDAAPTGELPGELGPWLQAWRARLAEDPLTPAERARGMRALSPAYIPRNHRVQAALDAAEAGDYQPFHTLLSVVQRPYDEQPDRRAYRCPPRPEERVLQTFCGT